MAANSVVLEIGTHYDGEGMRRLDNSLKTSSANVRKVSGAVSGMIGAMEGLDGSVGKFSRTAGNLLGGFLSMGVWGAIIGAVSAVAGWVSKIFAEEKRTAEELDKMNNAWKTAEGRAAAYARRVEEWRNAKKAADAAAKKAAEEEATALKNKQYAVDYAYKKGLEQRRAQMAAEQEYDRYLMQTAELKEQIDGMDGDQRAVNALNRQIAFDKKWGNRREEELGKLKLKALLKEIADRKAAEEARKKKEDDAATAAAEAKKKSAEVEMKTARERENMAKKLKTLDEKIATAREAAAQWGADAAPARTMSVNEWGRGKKEAAREAERAARKQRGNVERATAERERLIADMSRGRGFRNASNMRRLVELNDYLGKQNATNNPGLKEAERLEREKNDAIKKSAIAIEKIKNAIDANTTI